MKWFYFVLLWLFFTSSCELRSTNFDPDNQHISEDERGEINIWATHQQEKLSQSEYEFSKPDEFICTEFNYRQNANKKWVID